MGRSTQQKLIKRAEEDAEVKERLNKKFERVRRSKQIAPEELLKTMKGLAAKRELWVRNLGDWKARSYNPDKQKVSLVKWLLTIYDVPTFMYGAFTGVKATLYFNIFREWFIVLAQGQSFRKCVQAHLTRKEAALFLKGPKETIMENVWWARSIAAELSEGVINVLLHNSITSNLTSKFFYEFIQFLSRYKEEIDPNTVQEIVDFIMDAYRINPNYSFSGRTWGSIVRMSNEWHLQFGGKTKKIQYFNWVGFPIKNWAKNFKINKRYTEWKITQIKDSHTLNKEGRQQRHCVGGYAEMCRKGQYAMFTMESRDDISDWSKNLTIQVTNNTVAQVRGKCNRLANKAEISILRHWARENKLAVSTYI